LAFKGLVLTALDEEHPGAGRQRPRAWVITEHSTKYGEARREVDRRTANASIQ
jgi:hypothetical protein